MCLEDMQCLKICKVELVVKKDRWIQLEACKSSIQNLFNDLLDETKGFKCQIILKVKIKKYKSNGKIEFTQVYFNSITKIVINRKFGPEKLCTALKDGLIKDLNSTYRSLSGSSHLKLPTELRSPKKGLINIKNNGRKCLLWCHVRH